MSYKRFGPEDLVYNTLVAKPEYKFIIHSGSVYKNNEILPTGDFSNTLKHISNGEVSFHELNVNRPSGSLVSGFISKDTTRYAYRTITNTVFQDSSQFQYGNILTQSYPLKAGLSRIYIESGPEFDSNTHDPYSAASFASSNKKYIRSLRTILDSRDQFGKSLGYGNLGTSEINMVCIPAIFYGSKVDKGSIELNYYVTGTLTGQLKDVNSDGILVETIGPRSGSVMGLAIYEQGLMILTGSHDLTSGAYSDSDTFGSGISVSEPSWLNFATGLPVVGQALPATQGFVRNSSYKINFKGTNKIPTVTMFAYADKGEFNYSNNPSFLKLSEKKSTITKISYQEPEREIKNISKSLHTNHNASFESTTFISKVGIYDENKNLIAIATLANPIKKTPNRDYMIKMRLDF
jgi:hypothetical protein